MFQVRLPVNAQRRRVPTIGFSSRRRDDFTKMLYYSCRYHYSSVFSVPTRAVRLGILIARSPERHDSVDGRRAEEQLREGWFDIVVGVATSRARAEWARVGVLRSARGDARRRLPSKVVPPVSGPSAAWRLPPKPKHGVTAALRNRTRHPTTCPVAVPGGRKGPAAPHFRIFRIGCKAGRSRAAASYLWTILSGFEGRPRRQVREPRANTWITSWTHRHPGLAANWGSGNRRPRFRVGTDRKSPSGGPMTTG